MGFHLARQEPYQSCGINLQSLLALDNLAPKARPGIGQGPICFEDERTCLFRRRRLSSPPMNNVAAGFWGCYFGTTALMLAGSALAYLRSLHRISLNAALSALVSGFFVISFLGGLPISDPDILSRLLAHITAFTASILCYLLLSTLGGLKSSDKRRRAMLTLGGVALAAVAAGWLLEPLQAIKLSLAETFVIGSFALSACIRSSIRGDRLALPSVWGLIFMLTALVGLGWIGLDRQHAPWQAHIVSAVAATLYLGTMSWVLWARYSHLIELHEVMVHGPGYDPITRMRSPAETGNMVNLLFEKFRSDSSPLGIVVLTVVNLYTLDKLHGQAALNHALFVSAGRFRRAVPANIEMGRLGQGGFVLIMPNCQDSGNLIDLARRVGARLSKPVLLNTSTDVTMLEGRTTRWAADLGVGVLKVSDPGMGSARAIAIARAMSRTALSYASRVAWFDHASGEIVELPSSAPK